MKACKADRILSAAPWPIVIYCLLLCSDLPSVCTNAHYIYIICIYIYKYITYIHNIHTYLLIFFTWACPQCLKSNKSTGACGCLVGYPSCLALSSASSRGWSYGCPKMAIFIGLIRKVMINHQIWGSLSLWETHMVAKALLSSLSLKTNIDSNTSCWHVAVMVHDSIYGYGICVFEWPCINEIFLGKASSSELISLIRLTNSPSKWGPQVKWKGNADTSWHLIKWSSGDFQALSISFIHSNGIRWVIFLV